MKMKHMIALLMIAVFAVLLFAGCDVAAVQDKRAPATQTAQEETAGDASEPADTPEEAVEPTEDLSEQEDVEAASVEESTQATPAKASVSPAIVEEPMVEVPDIAEEPMEEPPVEEPILEEPVEEPLPLQPVPPQPEQEESQESTLTVSATETVTKEPDIAYVVLGVRTQAGSAALARQQNAQLAEKLLAALEKQDIAEDDIESASIQLYQDYEDATKYIAENDFRVTLRDLDRVGTVIDAAIAAGANTSYQLSFALEDQNAAYIEALGKAMQSVSAKASAVANGGGYELVRAQSLEEMGSSSYYDELAAEEPMEAAAEDAAGPTTPVIPQEIRVSASMTGTFIIK